MNLYYGNPLSVCFVLVFTDDKSNSFASIKKAIMYGLVISNLGLYHDRLFGKSPAMETQGKVVFNGMRFARKKFSNVKKSSGYDSFFCQAHSRFHYFSIRTLYNRYPVFCS